MSRRAEVRRRAPLLAFLLVAASGLAALDPTGSAALADPPSSSASARGSASAPPPAPPPSGSAASPSSAAGVAEFLAIGRVLQSPRCRNCHPGDDIPRIGDAGRKHRMNLSRLSMSSGLACGTCHRGKNASAPHSPPGAPGWRMPPEDRPMVFDGRTPHDLCEQLKDPARNGGKSLEALREHFARDPLVGWAWSPGPGRTLPPMPQAELVKHVEDWIAAGAPCP